MKIQRRKLIIGAAAALCAPHVSRAAFVPLQTNVLPTPAHRSMSQSPRITAKPTGIPALDQFNNINDAVLFYGFDTGLGEYVLLADCTPGHKFFPPYKYNTTGQPGGGFASNPNGVPALTTTRFGTGFKWPGVSAESAQGPAVNSWVWDTDTLRTALNLYSKPAGTGFTIAATFVRHAAADVSVGETVIFGRTARGFTEAAPNASICLSFDSRQKVKLWFYTNGAMAASTLQSPSTLALDALHTAVGTCFNTGSTFANHTSNVFNGQVFQGSMYQRGWSAKQ
jgi:hypothetical protein